MLSWAIRDALCTRCVHFHFLSKLISNTHMPFCFLLIVGLLSRILCYIIDKSTVLYFILSYYNLNTTDMPIHLVPVELPPANNCRFRLYRRPPTNPLSGPIQLQFSF